MIVSVIIPVYKVEKYIRLCIQSVLDQDCKGFNIECIIVDDASPDKSMDIVQELIDEYQGNTISFIVLRHDVNRGLSAARNTGIKAATGDYLFFIDSDDHIFENTLKKFVSFAVTYPEVDVIMGNSLCIGINVLTNSPVTNDENIPMLLDDKMLMWKLLLTRKLDHHAWNKLVKRSIISDYNLLFDDGVIYEDIPWTYRLVFKISSILIVPELTYLYEYNPLSIIHTKSDRAQQITRSFAFICDSLLNNPPLIDDKEQMFVEHQLFIQHWVFVVLDLVRTCGCEPETKKKLYSVKRRLFKRAVCHFHPILSLYSLLLFPPFKYLVGIGIYRSNINRLEKLVYWLTKKS